MERDEIIPLALESEARGPEQPTRWWWLSFVDGDRPKGEQFLGACMVQGRGITTAISRSWDLGCNPGGEVAFVEIPADRTIPDAWANRLLTRAEVESAELNAALSAPAGP